MAGFEGKNAPRGAWRWLLGAVTGLLVWVLWIPPAWALDLIQAPVAGKPFALPGNSILCGSVGGGWSFDAATRTLRPPTALAAVGEKVTVRVSSSGDCTTTSPLSLVATGRWPSVQTGSVVLYPDEERLELRGKDLRGSRLRSGTGDGVVVDGCFEPKSDAGLQRCAFRVARGVEADPSQSTMVLLPAGASTEGSGTFFDAEGHAASKEPFRLFPARVVLNRVLGPDAVVDLSSGKGEVVLPHGDALAGADCSPFRCELVGDRLVVTGTNAFSRSVDVRFRLLPHVALQRGDALDATVTGSLRITYCPMSVISGPPVRGVDSAVLIVRLEGGCAADVAALRFSGPSGPLKVLRREVEAEVAYVVLRLGHVDDDEVNVTAIREDVATVAVARARSSTRALPQVRATLSVGEYPRVRFIPTNRTAAVRANRPAVGEHFEVLSVDGIYTAHREGETMFVQGDPGGEGATSLRFGLRNDTLPPEIRDVDLAIVTEPLQRELREANIPLPIGIAANSDRPPIEVLCGNDKNPQRIRQGELARLPFDLRQACRVVFYRDRFSKESGTQKLKLDIEVLTADGVNRPEARVSETIRLRHGEEPRLAWVKGVVQPFDRFVIRIGHEADDAHYVEATNVSATAPAAQWSGVFGTSRARLYATTAIPAGLYRFGGINSSGTLSLNFGVISRLTWLSPEGQEGFLGLEGGVMVFGLANSRSASGQSLTEVGTVLGVGFAVPIANRAAASQASINLHAWLDLPLARSANDGLDRSIALIVGPSVSIGNVGRNL